MGNIQSGINQLITQFSVLSHLSPELRANAEKRTNLKNLEQRENILNKQYSTVRNETVKKSEALSELQKEIDKSETSKEYLGRLPAEDYLTSEIENNLKNEGDITREYEKLTKERFNLDPSEKTYKDYLRAGKRVKYQDLLSEGFAQTKQGREVDREEIMKKLADKGSKQIDQNNERQKFKTNLDNISQNKRSDILDMQPQFSLKERRF